MTDNETKKDYLKSYRNLCRKIKCLEDQLKELRESKSSVQAVVIDDMPKGTNQSDLSDYMVKVDELLIKIKNTKKECVNRRLEIENAITEMPDGLESKVLYERYIKFNTWEEICVMINYSWKHTHRIHSNALMNFKIKS